MPPTTAIASRRPAHATGPSISAGRYVYVTTIQTSGRAGNNAASRAKMITRITRLPTGPSDPKSEVRSSSREAIGGPPYNPQMERILVREKTGPALCRLFEVHEVQPPSRAPLGHTDATTPPC